MRLETLQGIVGRIFGAFALLAALDLTLIAASAEYRNLLGQVTGWSIIIRAIPSALLIAFYLSYFLAGNPVRRSRLAKVHSLVFALVGTAMLIPWIGMFFAACSPIAVLFFGPLLLSASVWVSYGVAAMFLALNASLLVAFLRCEPAVPTS